MALGDSITVGSSTMARLRDGFYIDESTTIDEPRTLEVKSTVKADADSSYLVKFARSANNGGLGVNLPDKVLSTHIVIKGDIKHWSESQINDEVAALNTFLTTPGVMTRILRGEV